MPIEPPGKIGEAKIVRREEHATLKQKKKQAKKEEPGQEPGKTGKIDIKI